MLSQTSPETCEKWCRCVPAQVQVQVRVPVHVRRVFACARVPCRQGVHLRARGVWPHLRRPVFLTYAGRPLVEIKARLGGWGGGAVMFAFHCITAQLRPMAFFFFFFFFFFF